MPALVPVDYDPFFDVAQQGPSDPNALVRLGPGGVTPAAAPNALQGALEAAYGLTGVPDLQAAYAAAARGEPLPALGQGAAGAAALIPALKPLAAAPFLAAGIKGARPLINALSHAAPAENALLPAGGEVNRAVNALFESPTMRDLRDIPAEEGYVYHATSRDRLLDMAQEGKLKTFKPNYGTDQSIWPDAATEKRAYFGPSPAAVDPFVPDFPAAIVRAKQEAIGAKKERGTGDLYVNKPVAAKNLEYWTGESWKPINELVEPSLTNSLAQDPIRAYHGSPYDFDAFDASKIGTGEGAQAYGHGLYFAEHPETAKNYKESTLYSVGMRDPAAYAVALRLKESGGDRQAALAGIQKEIEDLDKYMEGYKPSSASEMRDALSKNKAWRQNVDQQIKLLNQDNAHLPDPAGRMYEVNLNADPDTFLHWDKPLSEQPEAVQNAIKNLSQQYGPEAVPGGEVITWGDYQKGYRDPLAETLIGTPFEHAKHSIAESALEKGTKGFDIVGMLNEYAPDKVPQAQSILDQYARATGPDSATGEAWYKALANAAPEQPGIGIRQAAGIPLSEIADTSQQLHAAGINGIKYLDQGSRLNRWEVSVPGMKDPVTFSGISSEPELRQRIAAMGYNPADVTMKELPGTHNYVVFDPKIISIIKKYGLAPLIAGGAFATGGDANAATHLVPVDHDPFSEPDR